MAGGNLKVDGGSCTVSPTSVADAESGLDPEIGTMIRRRLLPVRSQEVRSRNLASLSHETAGQSPEDNSIDKGPDS
jgi:hypothetical protein